MQLTIHTDGNESPDQLRLIAAALVVLAGDGSYSVQKTLLVAGETLSLTPNETHAPPAGTLVDKFKAFVEERKVEQASLSDSDVLELAGSLLNPLASADTPAAAEPSTIAPAAAPVISAPPVSAPPQASVTGELDSRGYMWDERIHSGARSKVKNGSWTKRKGVQEPAILAVEAAQRAQGLGVPPGAAAAVVAPPTPAVAAPPGIAPPPGNPDDFRNLVTQLGGLMTAQKITQAQVAAAVAKIGLANLPELQKNLHLIPSLKVELGL